MINKLFLVPLLHHDIPECFAELGHWYNNWQLGIRHRRVICRWGRLLVPRCVNQADSAPFTEKYLDHNLSTTHCLVYVCGVSRTLCVICLSQIGVWMILDENVVVWGSMEWTIPKLIISTQLNIHTMDRVKEWEITETKSSSSFWYNVKRIGFPTF